ncbi:MAG TPA: DUF3300 domain-containing protein [Nitrospira sp.]|nr:DUF3300 domain-containing protein [Nitrospira sp.]
MTAMNTHITSVMTQVLMLLFSFSLVFAQVEVPPQQETPQEQETPPQDPPIAPPQQNVPHNRPAFTQQELDQMLAPIALYPDSLLSQILMASTWRVRGDRLSGTPWRLRYYEFSGQSGRVDLRKKSGRKQYSDCLQDDRLQSRHEMETGAPVAGAPFAVLNDDSP